MGENRRDQGVRAGIIVRMLASGYDLTILFGVTMLLVGIPITVSVELFGLTPPKWLQGLLFLSVTYAYFVGFWVKGGATTGMRPWKLRLAMLESGDPLSWFTASVRFAGLIITWLALAMTLWYIATKDTGHFLFFLAASIPAMSLLVMTLGRDHLALHDLLSGSGVYRLKLK
ncbi:RDD family protein [Mariprofundus ferrinatatus]|uniref:RDD family protein n=1 Tax=Mariprofundus ferrinatatus TaxID=1921087 RepID=A0A2K8L5L0_9PROT|nr:RDD family protein [Mariprofundus ferrinatatus]ATX81141.1 RDD family protein [Mariprofundus ferrinatatus]